MNNKLLLALPLLLLVGMLTGTVSAQPARIEYSTLVGSETGDVSVLEETEAGHLWLGAGTSGNSECPGTIRCTSLYRIDPRSDQVLARVVLPDIYVYLIQPTGDGLLIVGRTATGTDGALPHDPGLLWAASAPGATATHWMGQIDNNGEVRSGAHLQEGMAPTALHVSAAAVTVVANNYRACSPGCSRLQVARVSNDLRQVHFDTQPTPMHANTPSASAQAADGRLYIATAGALPTSAASAFSYAPPEEPLVQDGDPYIGGLLALDDTGELVHSTYTHTYPATQLAIDPVRNAIWLQARSTHGNLQATPDALDSTCGVTGNCNFYSFLCEAVGYCLGPGDVSLSRYDRDLRELQYATYLGSWQSNWPRALRVSTRGDLWVAWGSASPGVFYSGGEVHWLTWPVAGRLTRLGKLPIAPIDGPELFGWIGPKRGPLISQGGDFATTAVKQSWFSISPNTLVRSTGLDPACNAQTPCVQLTRTLLPRGNTVQQLPARAPSAALLLLVAIGLVARRRLG